MGKAEIFYCDIGDYLSREEKLSILKEKKSFLDPTMELIKLIPNAYGDWITSRNETFQTFFPLADGKKYDINTRSFFVVSSMGMNSQRDFWVWRFSKTSLIKSVRDTIAFYIQQLQTDEIDYDSARISWTRSLLQNHKRKNRITFDERKIALSLYRPFQKQHYYHGEKLIEVRYQFDRFFPSADAGNLIIATNRLGGDRFSCLISNRIVDLHCVGDSQCFPLYYYEQEGGNEKNKGLSVAHGVSGEETYTQLVRKDGVSDFIIRKARENYGSSVTKEDIFFYVYGYLHSPKYRAAFAHDLKKTLPRIRLADNPDDFWTFSKAGRELARLHLDYENIPPLPEVKVEGDRSKCRVTKMRFGAKNEKDTIIFNQYITVSNIPAKAYEYVINGKSAIEWLMERYQVKTDKASGISNDPNLYAEEFGQPWYILDLLLSVIAVSVRTVDIVAGLPTVV